MYVYFIHILFSNTYTLAGNAELTENDLDTQHDDPLDSESTTRDNITNLKYTAFWILKLKEKCNLTQSAVNEVLSDVTDFIKNLIGTIRKEVCKASFLM